MHSAGVWVGYRKEAFMKALWEDGMNGLAFVKVARKLSLHELSSQDQNFVGHGRLLHHH